MERRTRIWIGLGTALLVGSTGANGVVLARQPSASEAEVRQPATTLPVRSRILVAQADAAGEGGPGEGGGAVLGTITEFRLSSNDANAFAYDAANQVSAYASLVHHTYSDAFAAATVLRDSLDTLRTAPSQASLAAAREAWLAARAAYLRSEAFLFYAGPVDGPGGPLPRLNGWPVDPDVIDGILADPEQSLNFRAIARLNTVEPLVKVTTGLHVIEYLLWGDKGSVSAESFAGVAGARRGDYLDALAQLLTNDLSVLVAAWAPGTNNYRASVESMDQRNALGRAFNGMTVLLGYELPLRRIGAGLFPANEDFQPSPFSGTSAIDHAEAYAGARQVYFGTGLDRLVEQTDPELATRIAEGFERSATTLGAMDAPFERFLAPPAGSAERRTAEQAVRALTDLARDLRQAGNSLGVLVVVPGM